MTASQAGRLRLTVLGCSTAAPDAEWPAAAFLVEWAETRLLLDVGQGSIRRLQRLMDPMDLSAVVVGHMHADHYLDLVGLRYLFPWGATSRHRLPVYLPPGGRAHLDDLATAISERDGFFDTAFDVTEYEGERPLALGPLTLRFFPGRHYVPAWGVVVHAPDGSRLAYTGDTGPSESVVDATRDVDLLLVEAALGRADDDDAERGHLSADEAIDLAGHAAARAALIVHYAPARRMELDALCRATGSWIRPAFAGMTMTVGPTIADGRARSYETRPEPTAVAARDR